MGSIFGRDQKAYTRWSRCARNAPGYRPKGLTGAALESEVMRIAQLFPGNVLRGSA